MANLVLHIEGTLTNYKLNHELATLQRQVVMVGHGNNHLAQDTAYLGRREVGREGEGERKEGRREVA